MWQSKTDRDHKHWTNSITTAVESSPSEEEKEADEADEDDDGEYDDGKDDDEEFVLVTFLAPNDPIE